MNYSTMLYKDGSMAKTDGISYDYIIVPTGEVEKTLKQGYFRCYTEIGNSNETLPSREELESEAKELGISFRSNIKDAPLYEKILEARIAKEEAK